MALPTRTLAQLRDEARQRADAEGKLERFPDVDVTRNVNKGIQRTHDFLITNGWHEYLLEVTTLTTVADTATVALPVTPPFYKLRHLRVTYNGRDHRLHPIGDEDIPYQTNVNSKNPLYWRYQIHGANLRLFPTPSSAETLTMHYIPSPTLLVEDTDTYNGWNGWEEMVVLHAARLIALKDATGPTLANIDLLLKEEEMRLIELAPERDVGAPEHVIDIAPDGYDDDYAAFAALPRP